MISNYEIERQIQYLCKQIECLSQRALIKEIDYIGDDVKFMFMAPVDSIIFQVFTDGRLNTPLVEYTISNSVVTFIGAPSTGVSIQIFYQ